MTDCLLINPGGQQAIFQGLAATATALEPPIWARLIASYLRLKKLPAHILDAEALGLAPHAVAHLAEGYKPRLITIVVHGSQPQASSQKMPATTDTVKALKEAMPDVPVLLIGGHIAALPLQSLQETGADYVCTGEGAVTTYELAWRLKNKHGPAARGLMWLENGEPCMTSYAPNVQDLDGEMPGGCWDLLPMKSYRSYGHHGWTNGGERQPYATLYSSLGCPFRCGFCAIQSPFRRGDELMFNGKANSYRMWSADTIIKEIDTLVETYGVKNIRFNDEMFVLKPSHVNAICDRIIERYGDRLNLWCYGRVDHCREEFLDKLRVAGFKWLCLGVEAASPDVRDGVEKDEYGIEDIIETVARVKNHGINIVGNFIAGLPSDTHESMQQTLDLALELMPEYFNLYACVAMPGSPLWTDKIAAGWQPPKNWLAWSFHSYEHEPLGTNTLTPAEVLAFRDRAYQRYMRDAGYLDMVRRKFGKAVADSVIATADVKLSRRLLEGIV